jgi:hypothetical protein
MAKSTRMQERIRALARELAIEMGEVGEDEGDCWLDAIENRAVQIGDALAVAVMEERAGDRPLADESCCPRCGQSGRYRGDRQRELVSRRGPVQLVEAEYYCPACRKSFFPSDASHWS